MKHTLHMSRPITYAFACMFQGPVAIGRFLLMLATISLLTTPLTQHIWNWDHFLHGGQDFESGVLIIVTILCLAVLLSQLCKRHVGSWFAACCLFAVPNHDRALAGMSRLKAFFTLRRERMTDAAIGPYPVPLRI